MIINGTKYHTPCVLIVGTTSTGDLIFGSVISVLVHRENAVCTCMFEFKVLEAEFYPHHHAYALSALSSSAPSYLIRHDDLACYHPYGSYSYPVIPSDHVLRYTVIRSNVYV